MNQDEYKFAEAEALARANGLTLKKFSVGDTPMDTHYRIGSDACYKEISPVNQRIYCPDKKKQGPFISMKFGKKWNLLDVVTACVAESQKRDSKEPKRSGAVGTDALLDGSPKHTRMVLQIIMSKLVDSQECDDMQCALRDLLTDIRHIADKKELDFSRACDGSYEVYLQEKDEGID